MRTSRIARDTTRILAATRTQPLRRTRAAAAALNTVDAGRVANGEDHESASASPSESEFSSAPSDVGSDDAEAAVGRKRKRGQAAPVAVKREVAEVDVTAGASPKKQIKTVKKARRAPAKKITGKDGTALLARAGNHMR